MMKNEPCAEIKVDLERFQDGLKRAQALLDTFSSSFAGKIDSIFGELAKLSELTGDLRVADDSPAASLVNGEIERWQSILNACRRSAEREIKGRELQHRFEKTPLVIVFGIVKAGKSTLGNFLHGRTFREAPFDNVYRDGILPCSKIEVIENGREDEKVKEAFDEACIESTCSAQFFSMPGLTWMDTPGIGAVEKRDIDIRSLEGLAKQYVQYADLVVFLANSANPGVREDIEGYRNLYQAGKKAIVVITRSDTFETKVANGKIIRTQVPKDPARRRLQEESLCDGMTANGIPMRNGDVISISTQLAEKGVMSNDGDAWRGGNIGGLYQKLVEVIGSPEILKLKEASPRRQLDNCVDAIIGTGKDNNASLARLSQDLIGIRLELKKRFDALSPERELVGEIAEDVVNQVRIPLRRHIDGFVSAADGQRVTFDLKGLEGRISEQIADVLGAKVDLIVGGFQRDVLSAFRAEGISANAERRVQVESYSVEVPEVVERDPEGVFEHIGHFFGKKYHRLEMNEETYTTEIDLGFDPAEARKELLAKLESAIRNYVKGELAALRQSFFSETIQRVENVIKSVDRIVMSLRKMKFENKTKNKDQKSTRQKKGF